MYPFAPGTYTITSRGIGLTLPCLYQCAYVYLLHFKEPYKHAAHYLGSAISLEYRLAQHRRGTGARLMEVVKEAGISWEVSRIWQCDSPEEARTLEARLKRWHHDGRLCPICQHKSLDAAALMYYGHPAFHLFEKPGKRQPMGIPRPMFCIHHGEVYQFMSPCIHTMSSGFH